VHASDDDPGFVSHVLSMFPESRRSSRTGESEDTARERGVVHAVAKNLRTRNCPVSLELRRVGIGRIVLTLFRPPISNRSGASSTSRE
jgi:hypothetical protein